MKNWEATLIDEKRILSSHPMFLKQTKVLKLHCICSWFFPQKMFMCKINVHYHCPERFQIYLLCVCASDMLSLSSDHFAAIHNAMHNIKISLESIEATVLIIKSGLWKRYWWGMCIWIQLIALLRCTYRIIKITVHVCSVIPWKCCYSFIEPVLEYDSYCFLCTVMWQLLSF